MHTRLPALIAGLLVICITAPAASAPVLPHGASYVALGSSFAAGPGIPTQQATCGRSDHNYPHLVAAMLGLVLTDVSCGGATTANVLDTPQGDAALQLTALTADTALVTLTIGGNDLTYSASTIRCGGASAEDRCAAKLDHAAIDEAAERLPARLADVIDAIRAKAPTAIIVVVPYPRVIPPAAERCSAVGLVDQDADYFAALGLRLEEALTSVATARAALLADAFPLSAGHGPCAADADRWVNGAKAAGSGVSFHPTAKGHEEMAWLVLAALQK